MIGFNSGLLGSYELHIICFYIKFLGNSNDWQLKAIHPYSDNPSCPDLAWDDTSQLYL